MGRPPRARQWLLAFGTCVVLGCGEEADSSSPPAATAEPCGPMEVEDESGACVAIGVPSSACAEGFAPDDVGGCRAVLPADPCLPGEVALPGETSCRELAPCGAPPWGEIPVDGATQFVDASYQGADSDGSEQRPWLTIQQAVTAAAPGAIVAVAAGSYVGDVNIVGKPVILWGRCPRLVHLEGVDPAGVIVRTGADGTVVRGMALGGYRGLLCSGSVGLQAQDLWIHDTVDAGLAVVDELGTAELSVRNVLMEDTTHHGMFVRGSTVVVEDTAVRGTRVGFEANSGRGIGVQAFPGTGERAAATIRRVLVEDCHGSGLFVGGSDLELAAVLVRQNRGRGLAAELTTGTSHRSVAIVRQSVFEANHEGNLFVSGSTLTMRSTTVRSSDPLGTQGSSYGLGAQDDDETGLRPAVGVTSCLFEGNRGMAITLLGVDGSIERTLVRSTLPSGVDQRWGRGINVQFGVNLSVLSDVSIRQSIIDESHQLGLYVGQSLVLLEQSQIRSVHPQLADGIGGDGIAVEGPDSVLRLHQNRIEHCSRVGVTSFSSRVVMSSVALDCNPIHLNGESYNGPYTFEDLGANVCGCGEQREDCQVVSSALAPPEPVGPLPR